MAEYSTIPISLRIIVLLLLIAFLVVLGFIILNSLGVLDTRGFLGPLYRMVGIQSATEIDADDPLLLAHQRELKNLDALALREEELEMRAQTLSEREAVVQQKEEILADREKSLTEAEKSINTEANTYDDRRRRLEQQSETFRGMPPENAVKIMLEMNDQDVIEIFRVTEELAVQHDELSIVPYWLSLMPPERAAELNRKWR